MSVLMELEDKGWFNHSKMARTENGGVFVSDERPDIQGRTDEYGVGSLGLFAEGRDAEYQWFKELFRPTIQSNNSVSISSGTDRSRYYVSMSFLDDPGWSVSDKVRRYTPT